MSARDEHDRVEAMIPWHVNGSLPSEERECVERHAAECNACRTLLDDASLMAGLTESDFDDLLDHVHARHLEAYARGVSSMPDELALFVREHLDECDVCREALVPLRRAIELSDGEGVRPIHEAARRERDADVTGLPIWQALRGTVLHPAAAALYLVVALASTGLWLSATGGGEPGGTRSLSQAGGVIDLVVVSGPVRGEDGVTRIRLREGDGRVALGLDFEIPGTIDSDGLLTIAIESDDGRRLYGSVVPAGRARTSLVETGIVTILVAAESLEPGRLNLRVFEDGREGTGDALLDAWLDVE